MAVSLSAGVRNNLSTLQSTAAQSALIQNRLATGKKVNSAIDSPVNFFTAASLNDRSSQLTGLLDGITKLVGSLQSTVKQAQADAAQNRPTKAGTALATQAEVALTSKSLKDIALDKKLIDDDASAANNTATATSSGNLGIATANTFIGISLTAGSTTYEASFSSANATVRDLVNEINKSGIATAFVDEKGQLNVKGTGSEDLEFGVGAGTSGAASGAGSAIVDAQTGLANGAVGFVAGDAVAATAIKGQSITSAVRSNLIDQYNDLRNKIDDLAKDSSYNGINLLSGDRLSIVFNEKTGRNQTKLDIQGSNITSDNLGIPRAINTQLAGFINFQNDMDLEKATAALTSSLSSLKSLASTLGSNLSVAQTRQDFTKELANVLTTGAGNLVLADPNEEGASLLALNTRQQLSQTALSLANQADQGVLRLFG